MTKVKMKFFRCVIIGLWFLCACAPADKCHGLFNNGPVLSILFIGNSYTFVNDLPGTFSRLACSGGHQIEVDIIANGGWTLSDHAASSKTLDKIKQKKWDIIILQEQSEIPAIEGFRIQNMYPAARFLVKNIKENGSQAILFNTWAHRNGLPQAGLFSFSDMQTQLNVGYTGIALEMGIPVVPVGNAWLEAEKQTQPVDLWQEDGSHPNEQGTYLAACVFYAKIFNQSPVGLVYRAALTEDTAKALQSFAKETVLK